MNPKFEDTGPNEFVIAEIPRDDSSDPFGYGTSDNSLQGSQPIEKRLLTIREPQHSYLQRDDLHPASILLRPQSDRRVDARRAPGGNGARERRDGQQHYRYPD